MKTFRSSVWSYKNTHTLFTVSTEHNVFFGLFSAAKLLQVCHIFISYCQHHRCVFTVNHSKRCAFSYIFRAVSQPGPPPGLFLLLSGGQIRRKPKVRVHKSVLLCSSVSSKVQKIINLTYTLTHDFQASGLYDGKSSICTNMKEASWKLLSLYSEKKNQNCCSFRRRPPYVPVGPEAFKHVTGSVEWQKQAWMIITSRKKTKKNRKLQIFLFLFLRQHVEFGDSDGGCG